MGGKGNGDMSITSNSLEAVADNVEERVLPQLAALVDEKLDARPDSSGELEKIVDERVGKFVTQDELKIAIKDLKMEMMNKCDDCKAPSGTLGIVKSRQDAVLEQINQWRGTKIAHGIWTTRLTALGTAVIVTLLGFALNAGLKMRQEQKVRAESLSAQVAAVLMQRKAHDAVVDAEVAEALVRLKGNVK